MDKDFLLYKILLQEPVIESVNYWLRKDHFRTKVCEQIRLFDKTLWIIRYIKLYISKNKTRWIVRDGNFDYTKCPKIATRNPDKHSFWYYTKWMGKTHSSLFFVLQYDAHVIQAIHNYKNFNYLYDL